MEIQPSDTDTEELDKSPTPEPPGQRFGLEGFVFSGRQKRELSQIIGKNYAQENLILPLSLEGTRLTLGVCSPEKISIIPELKTVYAYLHMAPVRIDPRTFYRLFRELYGVAPLGSTPGSDSQVETLPTPESTGLQKSPPGQAVHRVEAQAAEMVRYLITCGLDAGASSIHIEQGPSGPAIRCRIDGVLQPLESPRLREKFPRLSASMIATLKTMAGVEGTERRVPRDGIFNFRYPNKENDRHVDVDIRVAVCPVVGGENITLRFVQIPRYGFRLDELHHSVHVIGPFKRLLDGASGLILISGPAGSGKTDTLSAAAAYLLHPGIKLVSVESSVRQTFPGIMQIQTGTGPEWSGPRLLDAALRHEPDVLLLNGSGDFDLLPAAFDTVRAGLLIIGTLAANDAVDTLFRLRALGISPDQIGRSLIGVLAQRRVRKICPGCRERYLPDADLWQRAFGAFPYHLSFFRGRGCRACRFTGYQGGMILSEMLPVSEDLIAAFQGGMDAQGVRARAVASGMKTMAQDALLKLNRTTLDELLRELSDRDFRCVPTSPGGPDGAPSEKTAPPDPEPRAWTLASVFSETASVDQMYRYYRRLKADGGHPPVPSEAELFREFVFRSHHRICQEYGCRQVTFFIETHHGAPLISASPGVPYRQDR